MKTKIALYFFIFFQIIQSLAQTAEIKGKITDENGLPIAGVSVFNKSTGVNSDDNGEFTIRIPSNISVNLSFSHISFETHNASFKIPSGKSVIYTTKLKAKSVEIEEVIVRDEKKISTGNVLVKTETIKNIPGANAGVENILKTLPGVNFNNELSTQYNVRGGSFEENLVYVNGIEAYRPFLVRSAEQEGLSFVNSQMTENVVFSGGWFSGQVR
ncbi:MAG: carboxypeptidase-like regulatory domain-containing protein [Flavobacteriaceae bacterium]|nr:carboxypeptidase-like regulatory domain-containing protein [Flavobacteriaceae bacterium]